MKNAATTAHVDTFARDNLPPAEQQPEFIFDLPELQYPERLNCASALLDGAITRGWGGRAALIGDMSPPGGGGVSPTPPAIPPSLPSRRDR